MSKWEPLWLKVPGDQVPELGVRFGASSSPISRDPLGSVVLTVDDLERAYSCAIKSEKTGKMFELVLNNGSSLALTSKKIKETLEAVKQLGKSMAEGRKPQTALQEVLDPRFYKFAEDQPV